MTFRPTQSVGLLRILRVLSHSSYTGISKFQNTNMCVANEVEYDLIYWRTIKLLKKLYQHRMKVREQKAMIIIIIVV